jgi:hypothetical protein
MNEDFLPEGKLCAIRGCGEKGTIRFNYSDWFTRFGKYWRYSYFICKEHEELRKKHGFWKGVELEKKLDKKRRTRIRPYYCDSCGRQATKELRYPVISRESWVDIYPVCEKHWKKGYDEDSEKISQGILEKDEETLRWAKERHQKNLGMIVGKLDEEFDKFHGVEFDKKKIH